MNIPLMDKQVMNIYKHMHFSIKENTWMREIIIRKSKIMLKYQIRKPIEK